MPPFGFSDENNLSLVVFVRCGLHKIIFPGDMEKPGWRQLLLNPAFRRELQGVNLFVASHHGRENGYCEKVMDLCGHIDAVIISDKIEEISVAECGRVPTSRGWPTAE